MLMFVHKAENKGSSSQALNLSCGVKSLIFHLRAQTVDFDCLIN